MTSKKIARTSEINIKVHLDEQNIPESMEWAATDADFEGFERCEAFLLSIWDAENKNALRIDLWTKELRVDEMDMLVYQTLATLSQNYQKATGNQEGSEDIKNFALAFAKNAGIIKS